jgi:hypothetical protein
VLQPALRKLAVVERGLKHRATPTQIRAPKVSGYMVAKSQAFLFNDVFAAQQRRTGF